MKKKIFALSCALIMVLALALPSFAVTSVTVLSVTVTGEEAYVQGQSGVTGIVLRLAKVDISLTPGDEASADFATREYTLYNVTLRMSGNGLTVVRGDNAKDELAYTSLASYNTAFRMVNAGNTYYFTALTFEYSVSDILSAASALCDTLGFPYALGSYSDDDLSSARQGGYDSGYSAGVIAGKNSVDTDSYYQSGYDEGYTAGQDSVDTDSYYQSGYDDGAASIDTDSYYEQGFDEGYSYGEQDGYDDGYGEGYAEGASSVDTTSYYDSGYAAGYDTGFREGEQSEVSGNFIAMIGEIASAPYNAVKTMFDFEILGINVAGLIFQLFTIAVTVILGSLFFKFIF